MSETVYPEALHFANSPIVSPQELHKDARQMCDTLASCGISVPPSSRVWQYLAQFELLEKFGREGTLGRAADLQVLHHGLSELQELITIVQELSRPPAVAGWPSEMRRVLGDPAMPSSAQRLSPSRDLQFQLWLAAILRRAAYEVVLSEPDVLVRDEAFAVGLAAKRLKSASKLDARFREASRQIVASGHSGIVAMDLSPLFNPSYETLVVGKPEDLLKVVADSARGFLDSNIRRIWSLVDRQHVIGVVVVAKGLFLVGSRLAHSLHAEWKNLCPVTDNRYPGFFSLVRRFGESAAQ